MTVHTGLTQAEHKLFNLTDGQHADFEQLWERFEDAGIACGIVGPINSRRGKLRRGFYIPDPWSANDDVFPEELRNIYNFLRDRVQTHDQTLEVGRSKLRFLIDSLHKGVRISTLLTMGGKYLASRFDRRRRWRLATDYDRYLLDLALALQRRMPTAFSSVYLTSVAHYQHRYWTRHDKERWKSFAPGLFAFENPLEKTDLHRRDDPIAYGLANYDQMIGHLLTACPEAELILLSGLSQVPFEGDETGSGFYLYRPYDHDKLFRQLGIVYEQIVPLISRDLMMYFRGGNERKRAVEILQATLIGDRQVFRWTEETQNRLFVSVAFTLPANTGMLITSPKCSKPLVFEEWLQFVTFKTGEHHGSGFAVFPRQYQVLMERDLSGQLPLPTVHGLLLKIVSEATGVPLQAPGIQEMRLAI